MLMQDREVVEAKVIGVILKILGKKDKKVAQITRIFPETKITVDLGFDPVDNIILSLELEEIFGINLDDCHKEFCSVGEIVDYILDLNHPGEGDGLLLTNTQDSQPAAL